MTDASNPSRQEPIDHLVKGIPFKAHKISGFTPEMLERYYEKDYGGTIRALSEIDTKIAALRHSGSPKSELASYVRQQAALADLVVLQELFLAGLAGLAEDGGADIDDGDLKKAICETYGDVAGWQAEFAMMAVSQSDRSGWVALAWCARFDRLQIVASEDGRLVLGSSVPILALDLREQVYAADFDGDQLAYVKTYLNNIHWDRVAEALQHAKGATHHETKPSESSELISVAELKSMMQRDEDAPLVLDVRHDDDCERYTSRISDTAWRESFKVAEWVNEMPKDKPVIVYCMYGFWVSQKVAQELRAAGVDARSLEGGVTAWRAMGFPSTEY